MKKGIITAGLAGAMLVAQAMPAQAINKEWSAVAGFVGGMLFANAANNNAHHSRGSRPGAVAHRQPAHQVHYQPVQQKVVYQQPIQQTVIYEEQVQTGYWAWRTKRVYVPGRWVYEDTGCGTQRKVWYPAHYKTKRYKVWVDTTCRTDW